MSNFAEGDVVICTTGQSGTLVQAAGAEVWVLLENGDLWIGLANCIRLPQGADDLAACPRDVDRFEKRERISKSAK